MIGLKKKSNRYNHNYELIKKYIIKKIFNILNNEKDLPDKLLYNNNDYNDSSRRAKILKALIERDGCECKKCKIKPSYFSLGKDFNGFFHLDLYTDKDKIPYMFTIDHIHPKSKGGLNHIDNYQLLCKICNEDKSDWVEGEEKEQVDNKLKNYIKNKLKSLDKQTNAVLNKLKRIHLVSIKNRDGFTTGNIYKVEDIKVLISDDFKSEYIFYLKNDSDESVPVTIDNFLTKKDIELNENELKNNI